MAEFFASTAKGLVDVLESEFRNMGFKVVGKNITGIFFESSWEECYRANLSSRIASRIMKPILDFIAYQPEDLYGQVLKHDFTKYIRPDQTLMVDAVVSDCKIHDQRLVAMKIKDAIVDQFREKFGSRPDVDNKDPDLRVQVRAVKNEFSLSIDTTGDSLFMRGYRMEAGEAPLKENLAASLLKLAEWDQNTPVVDLMCGSGTILIEAALMALNIAPGSLRKGFGFQRLLNYDEEAWNRVLDKVMSEEKEDLPFKMYGYDIDKIVLQKAKGNARRAGVDNVIEFTKESVAVATAPEQKGIIITNPPYGARIGEEENLRDIYRDLGFTLKNRFKGWTAWIISGNRDLTSDIKLKAARKIVVYNGNIECRFLKYEVF